VVGLKQILFPTRLCCNFCARLIPIPLLKLEKTCTIGGVGCFACTFCFAGYKCIFYGPAQKWRKDFDKYLDLSLEEMRYSPSKTKKTVTSQFFVTGLF
jgi:hypothetical protein